MRKIITISVVYLLFHICEAQTGDYGQCSTPNRESGRCINLQKCGELYTLLQKTPLYEDEKLFLRRSQCGWDNGEVLICCSNRQLETRGPAPAPNRPQNPSIPTNMNNNLGSTSVSNNLIPEPGVCGKVTSNKIFGGVDTKIDEYAWLAQIEYEKPNNKRGFHCGGSLISNRYVLTASHCINPNSIPEDWTPVSVRLGEWDTTTDIDCDNGDCADPHKDVGIERIIGHPEYNPHVKNQPNDIALLRLVRFVEYTDFIKPVCLPTNLVATFDGASLDVTGWGKTETMSASTKKLKATVKGVNLNQCNSVYSKQGITLTNKQLCAGGELGVDSCRGDSGGPLLGLTNDVKKPYYYIVGVVSFGPTPCGLQGWPGVYTKISEYVNWIKQNVQP